MNYLAHLFLSANQPADLIGNMAVDFLCGARPYRHPDILAGIKRHHLIDTFTDNHPCFRASRQRVSPPHHRYAPVVIDIFYDHFLALHWDAYASHSLADFTQWAYAVLTTHRDWLPPRLQHMLPHMVAEDWLRRYADIGGIRSTLNGLSRRAKRDIQLADTLADLDDHYDALSADFHAFYPQLIAAAESLGKPLCGQLPHRQLSDARLTTHRPPFTMTT